MMVSSHTSPSNPAPRINLHEVPNLHVNTAYRYNHLRKSRALQPAHQHAAKIRKKYSQRINVLGAITPAIRIITIEFHQFTNIPRVNIYQVALYEAHVACVKGSVVEVSGRETERRISRHGWSWYSIVHFVEWDTCFTLLDHTSSSL
jgi:hypothetical protein